MTPQQLKETRHTLGLTLEDMATMLGYTGKHRRNLMHEIENGKEGRTLKECQIRLLTAYLDGYRPADWPE